MTNKRNRQNKIDKEELEYSFLGDAFMGSSINMDDNLDNSLQNIIISMERDKININLGVEKCQKLQKLL